VSLVLGGIFAQTDTRPRFEVTSVKPSDVNSRSSRWSFPPGQAVFVHTRLQDVVPLAYGLQSFLVSGGPAWFAADFYDIVGKLPRQEGVQPSRRQALEALQVLLEDRFRLRIHWDSKNLSLYRLTIAKGGSKLKEGEALPENTPKGFEGRYASRIVRNQEPLSGLVTALSAYVQAPVEDQTGLEGLYSFVLEWQHEEQADGTEAAMFAALRKQLGLNLESGNGPVKVLVIDSAARPDGN
jgi:uncharacterized protein (TIGR03435 family)